MAARVLVLGMGRSGCAAARLMVREGSHVTGYDRDPSAGACLRLPPELFTRVSGATPPEPSRFDQLVASPGFPVPRDSRAIPEIDVAADHLRAPLIAVTGTNGKSTVTTLISEMLRASGLGVAVGGNLGTPLSALVDDDADRVVAEVSSFQLERARRLHPDVAVLLNLAPDHLDRHGTLAAYAAAKARLASLQTAADTRVVNLDDRWAAEVEGPGRRLGFTLEAPPSGDGAGIEGGELVVRLGGAERLRLSLEALAPAARIHLHNALAAALAALVAGAAPSGVAETLESFAGLEHRGTEVCSRAGVRYVDDSKATNPSAAAASVRAQRGPVIWLLGGQNKDLAFETLRAAARAARLAICFGNAAAEIAAALRGAVPVTEVDRLEAAVQCAHERARAGDVVLLAPGCASFDAFASYAERGERFAALACALPGPAKGDPA
ncbi:MAG: UDP-N-acetylmuramoyl-L-alanine--D-glutamate ligase [Myxococcota bacterium]